MKPNSPIRYFYNAYAYHSTPFLRIATSGTTATAWVCYDGVMKDEIVKHKDGSIWAKGKSKDGQPHGYWEWYRLNGSLMRSGHFEAGKQTGEWIT